MGDAVQTCDPDPTKYPPCGRHVWGITVEEVLLAFKAGRGRRRMVGQHWGVAKR